MTECSEKIIQILDKVEGQENEGFQFPKFHLGEYPQPEVMPQPRDQPITYGEERQRLLEAAGLTEEDVKRNPVFEDVIRHSERLRAESDRATGKQMHGSSPLANQAY